MCNYEYSALNSGHQCPYSDLFESLKTTSIQGIDLSPFELSLPIDSDGICLFHSSQEDWKRKNQFMKRYLELVTILGSLTEIEYLDFIEFKFVGLPDSTVKRNKTINAVKINNILFEKEVKLNGAVFLDLVVFEKIEFKKGGELIGTQFKDQLSVKKSTLGFVQWDKSVFEGKVEFSGCHFSGVFTDFSNSDFRGSAFFDNCIFDGMTLFEDVEFNSSNFQDNGVRFADTKFNDHLSFKNAVFFCPAEFRRTVFNKNAEFLDTVFHPSRSGARYVTADVFFNKISVGENALLTFEGRDFDNKIFDTEVEFSLDENVKGKIRFVNVNFQKITKKSKERLIQLEKFGFVEIGKGCVKYRYQTESKIVAIDKDCQSLVLDLAHTFSNYFSAENGINLGVEVVERLDDSIKYFYFSDENIGEKEFHDRLASTEEELWSLFYNGPKNYEHANADDVALEAVPRPKYHSVINAIDGMANLVSAFMKISVRISFGKWDLKDTQALTSAIKFNDDPVCHPQVLHQVIVNKYSQNVWGAFKSEQTQVVETLPEHHNE